MPLRLAAVLLSCAGSLAQTSRPASGPGTDPFGSTGALVALQAHDGRWVGAGPGGDEAERRATGLALLALLADGSTMRVGPHRGSVRKAVQWARDHQDVGSGRVGAAGGDVATDALWAFALVHACQASSYMPIQMCAESAAAHAVRRLDGARESPEAMAWLALTVASARRGGLRVDAGSVERWLARSAASPPREDLPVACELLARAVLDETPWNDARSQDLVTRAERWSLRDAGAERAVDTRAMLFVGLAFLALEDRPGFGQRQRAWGQRVAAGLADHLRPSSRGAAGEVEALAVRLLLGSVHDRYARLVEHR